MIRVNAIVMLKRAFGDIPEIKGDKFYEVYGIAENDGTRIAPGDGVSIR